MDLEPRARWFKCEYNNQIFGRYRGTSPKQAAKKACRVIFKKHNPEGNTVNFNVTECTRRNKKKCFYYIGRQEVIENPPEIMIGGKLVRQQFKYKVTHHDVPQAQHEENTRQKINNMNIEDEEKQLRLQLLELTGLSVEGATNLCNKLKQYKDKLKNDMNRMYKSKIDSLIKDNKGVYNTVNKRRAQNIRQIVDELTDKLHPPNDENDENDVQLL